MSRREFKFELTERKEEILEAYCFIRSCMSPKSNYMLSRNELCRVFIDTILRQRIWFTDFYQYMPNSWALILYKGKRPAGRIVLFFDEKDNLVSCGKLYSIDYKDKMEEFIYNEWGLKYTSIRGKKFKVKPFIIPPAEVEGIGKGMLLPYLDCGWMNYDLGVRIKNKEFVIGELSEGGYIPLNGVGAIPRSPYHYRFIPIPC